MLTITLFLVEKQYWANISLYRLYLGRQRYKKMTFFGVTYRSVLINKLWHEVTYGRNGRNANRWSTYTIIYTTQRKQGQLMDVITTDIFHSLNQINSCSFNHRHETCD